MKLPTLSSYLLATLCTAGTVLGHSPGEEKQEDWTQDDADELERKWGFDVRLCFSSFFSLSILMALGEGGGGGGRGEDSFEVEV
jgi:hypothetical protein